MIKLTATFTSAAFVALIQPFVAVAQPTQSPPAWDWPGPWHMMSGGSGFWWMFPLLVLFAIIMCVLMARRPSGHSHHSPRDATASALQLLNERFAKGEIKKEEYEEKRAVIVR